MPPSRSEEAASLHTPLQQFLELPRGGRSLLDPLGSETGRAGLPGWGPAVHAEKRKIKNTVVPGSQEWSVAEQRGKKKFSLIVETEETTCSEDVQCLVKTPLEPC